MEAPWLHCSRGVEGEVFMGEVDRRGFLRLRRAEKAEEKSEEREPSPKELQIRELAEYTASLLADVESEDEERMAEDHLLTVPYDLSYMRVTSGHVVFSIVTGFSAILKVGDVRAFDTEPPIDVDGYGSLVIGILHSHHPADPPAVTRSYGFRFPAASPLIPAIRTACDIPEPEEPEAAPEETPAD
jgi:hypothetical protein